MKKKLRSSLSLLLSFVMVFSVFAVVPFTASAAVGDVLSESEYLTFTAEAANSSVTLNVASGSDLQYDLNGAGLTGYTAGTQITLANAGDYVRFSGTGTKFSSSKHFSITGKVACSGNVMSLRLNGGKVQGLENLCFRYLFYNCTGLTTAPDLLETDLKAGCYSYMFNGCTSLTTAPDLPATTLAESCYNSMFRDCTSLTTAPDLPATTLAESCYNSMFMGCTSLTTAPDLPATVLAINCYLSMFNGCTSLTEAPELPATTLANYCYQNMFKGCTKLTETPELTATTLASYCYSNMFRDCQRLTEAPELPATNLAQYCYASMFYGCTSLTKAPELPATDLAVSCYNYMFYGCTSLTELPALPATTLANNCYYGMFYGCSKICISDEAGTFGNITYSAEYRIPTTGEGTLASGALTNMFANTGGKFKGTPDINTTYYLPAPAPTTYTVTWKNWDGTELEKDENVAAGSTPSYDGADPTKPEDANNTYTFAGWSPEVSAVTGDVTYTAQFDETPKPHQHDGITFEPWTSTNSLPSTAGNYYLTQDLTIYSEWRAPAGTTRICLNGHKITTYEHFLMVSGTALEIYDEEGGGSVDARYRVGSMFWIKGGELVLNGGTINGNVSTAGIVDVAANATFTMNGGTLTGRAVNRSDACGIRFTGTGATFNMNGGEITGLITSGGVTNFEINKNINVNINISGSAKIYGNTLTNGTTRNLYLPENTAVNVGELGSDATIGVTMQTPGVFTNSTDISNNDASKFFSDKSDYIVGKNSDGQLVLGVPVASVTSNGTTTKYTDFAQAVNAWAPASAPAGSTLTLLANINYNPGISVAGTKTLDLNGHGINGTGTIVFNGDGILTDSNPDTVHYFDVQNGLAVNINDNSGEKSFTGGYLTGGTGDWGSALQVNGALTMNGGTVIGNTSNYSGAVRVHNNKTLIMTGGQIIYNCCAAQRGGNDASLNAESNAIIKISGNPVIKNNVNPAGKPANVMVRITFANKLNVIGDLTDGAEIGITMQTNAGADYTGAFTASTDTSFNDASKFFSDDSSYAVGKNAAGQLVLGVPRTVTWLNDDGTTIDTTTVADGAVPTHEAPTKLGNNFAGWKNGETTYAPDALPNVTGDVTYTATFTPKKLISNCNLTLDGDIIINFNIDPSAAGLTPENIGSGKELTVTFEWAKDFTGASDKPKTNITKYSKTITVDSSNVGSKIPVSCPVCAAEMSCQVRATATLNGTTETKDYSVRDYADSVIDPREGSSFANLRDNNPTAYAKLVNLVSAMVDYGARAQKVFNINTSDLANKNLTDYEMEDVTDDMFVTAVKNANEGQTASDMKDVAAQLGANYYTTSLIFLDRSTLRHYFTKKDSSFDPSLYDGNQSDTYYFKVKENIPAHQLDKLQEFTVGSTTFYYSALDYARVLNASSAATADMKDLAKSLYWYNDAANAYVG